MLAAALAIGLLALVSAWSRPAFASDAAQRWAPYCDDRGATAVAPPPALEAPDEAIRRAAASPCAADELALHAVASQGHRSHPRVASDGPHGLVPRALRLAPPPGERLTDPAMVLPVTSDERVRLERPPRG